MNGDGRVIHAAAILAAVVAATSIFPGPDTVLILPIQVLMVVLVARSFEVDLADSLVQATVYSSLGQMFGKALVLLLGALPLPDLLVRGLVAFSVTETLGWVLRQRLSSGRSVI